MQYYKADDVRKAVTISKYLADHGANVRGDRTVATWREGENYSVSFDDAQGVWHDHVTDEGGDIFTLFAKVEGGGFERAVEVLGERYNAPFEERGEKADAKPDRPKQSRKRFTRGEFLLREGFTKTATYTYRNADGSPRYFVDRFEKVGADGQRVKEFGQRGLTADNMQGVERTLYNLPAIATAQVVFLCEGEKDADTLTRLGFTATTNSGGCKFWQASFGELLKGKDVVLLLDNDTAGQERVKIADTITPHANSVKVLTISKLPKGDVTDWLTLEGGTAAALMQAVDAAPAREKADPAIAAAKLANEKPLTNYVEGEPYLDEQGRKHKTFIPRPIDDICNDISTRFLGFPKRLGDTLFDCVKDKREILTLLTENDLKAWCNGTSHKQSEFRTGLGYATFREVQSRLLQTRQKYDVVSKAPWYPARDDAFPLHAKLPPPSPNHCVFAGLMAHFLPATEEDAALVRAMYMAPMFSENVERPGWEVDTKDGQGSGKSKLVEKVALVYADAGVRLDLKMLEDDTFKVTRQLLSTEGRKNRVFIFDNVTQTLKSSALASLMTGSHITGMRAYGRGTEVRRNDITWCVTVNGAATDTDMAVRFYLIRVMAPLVYDKHWEEKVDAYILANREQLWADIQDMLANAKPRARRRSRFGKFDSVVLSAACGDDDDLFARVDAKLTNDAEAANEDTEKAAECVEAITEALGRIAYLPGIGGGERVNLLNYPAVIKCSDVDTLLRETNGGVRYWTSKTVRRYVNAKMIPQIMKGLDRVYSLGKFRVMAFSPNPDLLVHNADAQVVEFKGGKPQVTGHVLL